MAPCHSPSETTVVVTQTDVQIHSPEGEGSRAVPLPQNGLGGPAMHLESPGALILQAEQSSLEIPSALAPAPNGDQVQVHSQAGSPNAQIRRPENAPPVIGVADPATTTGDAGSEVRRNRQKLNKLFFPTAIQFALAMLTVLFSDAKHALSDSAWFLIYFAAGCNIVSYICSFSSIFLCQDSTGFAPRVLTLAIYALSAFSYISIMGLLLPDMLNLGFTFLGCAACLPALVAAYRG